MICLHHVSTGDSFVHVKTGKGVTGAKPLEKSELHALGRVRLSSGALALLQRDAMARNA